MAQSVLETSILYCICAEISYANKYIGKIKSDNQPDSKKNMCEPVDG